MAVNAGSLKNRTVWATIRGKFKDDYSPGLTRFHSTTARVFSGLAIRVAGLASAYVGLRSAMDFFKDSIAVAATWERLKMTLEALYKSVEIAGIKFKQAVEFAAKTPYEVDKVVDAFIKLKVYGMDSLDWLRKAGDMAATFGRPISEAVRALGLLKSGAFGDAFMRLRELFGITYDDLRAKGLEFAGGQFKGTIEQALDGVAAVIDERYSGMMAKLSSTYDGVKSNFSDTTQQLKNEIGQHFLPYLKQALLDMQSLLSENKDKMVRAAVAIADVLIELGKGVIVFFKYTAKAVQGWQLMLSLGAYRGSTSEVDRLADKLKEKTEEMRELSISQSIHEKGSKSYEEWKALGAEVGALREKLAAAKEKMQGFKIESDALLGNISTTDDAANSLKDKLSDIQKQLRASADSSKEMADNIAAASGGAAAGAADGGQMQDIPLLPTAGWSITPGIDVEETTSALEENGKFLDLWAEMVQEKTGVINDAYASMAAGTASSLYAMLFAHEFSLKGIINMLANELAAVMQSLAARATARAVEFQTMAAVSAMNPMTAWASPLYAGQAAAMWSLAGWAMATAPILGAVNMATGGGATSSSYGSSGSSSGGSTYAAGSGAPAGQQDLHASGASGSGGAGGVTIKLVTVLTEADVAKALNSDAGEEVIVHRVAKNALEGGQASKYFVLNPAVR